MAADPLAPILRLLLSREELLVILNLLDVAAFPGVGPDPLGELTVEQQAYALIVAERALRARELALLDDAGNLLVQRPVLDLVGACAYAGGLLLATSTQSPGGLTAQWFGHHFQETFVAQHPTESVLYQFAEYANRADLVQALAAFCGWPADATAAGGSLTLPQEQFVAVREMAGQAQRDDAAAHLVQWGATPEAAGALAELLASPHTVTVLQALQAGAEDTAIASTVTVLHGATALWLVYESSAAAEGEVGPLVLRPATRQEIASVVAGLPW